MATLKRKISIQSADQQPEFIKSDHPGFLEFLKAYYEFLESAELTLSSLGSRDFIINEEGIGQYILQQDENRYRTDVSNKIVAEDSTTGAFAEGETITGSTSKATATIRVEDINNGSRLFISAQNKFVIGETITGGTTGATGVIGSYTANPVQTVADLLDYHDVDGAIDSFFTQWKETFMKTIPRNLTGGLQERTILKNIKDLYRAKGTRMGHKLFFRMLLGEEVEVTYPNKDMIKASGGIWTQDTIIRARQQNDTLLAESTTVIAEDYLILEDGAQILNETQVTYDYNFLNLVGQTITQKHDTATAVVDKVSQYFIGGEEISEFTIQDSSITGTWNKGHQFTAIDNTNDNITIYGKVISVLEKADLTASTFATSQYHSTDDTVTVTANNGSEASAAIVRVSSGNISSIIADTAGTGYSVGDAIVVNNANTDGAGLAGEVSIVNGGFVPETGTLTGQFRTLLEAGTPGQPGEMTSEQSEFTYTSPTGTFQIGETVTGASSGASAEVILVRTDIKTVETGPITGTFTAGEKVNGGTSGFSATLETATAVVYMANEDDTGMVATDRINLEPATTRADAYTGDAIVQEGTTGPITDIRVTSTGYGYTSLPTLTITSSGSSGVVRAVGTGVGEIAGIDITNHGIDYTDADTTLLTTNTNFLCTSISGSYTLGETVTGGTSGATGVFVSQNSNTGVIQLKNLSVTPFEALETITGGSSTRTAVIHSFVKTVVPLAVKPDVVTSGKYNTDVSHISEETQRIQDSLYYQDFSYVVKSGSYINDWRDALLSSVHPAGWAVFGQVDISSKVEMLSSITSISGLGAVYKAAFAALVTMRLGTSDQGTLNTSNAATNEPGEDPIYQPRLEVDAGTAFTTYETITGGTSGATGRVTLDAGAPRIVTFESDTGIFRVGETITGATSGRTTVVRVVYGQLGQRDRTLTHILEIMIRGTRYGTGYSFAPNYDSLNKWGLSNANTESSASSRTFLSHDVYPVYISKLTTISSGINNSVTTIPVAALDNFPTSGTIKIGTEEITYTGKSAASGAGNLTGGTRGANSTSAAAHNSGAAVILVRMALRQEKVSGYRISDWATDQNGTSITMGDIINNSNYKNNISPPTEITMYKT